MGLSKEELASLVELKHRTPHQLLGLHPLADGSGLIARVMIPKASAVEIRPLGDGEKPTIHLQRIANTDVFEGTTNGVTKVFPYEIVVTGASGEARRTRDPYSFLPTLNDADLYLFGKGDERRLYDKMGAQLRTID